MSARAVPQQQESRIRKWGTLMVLSLALAIIIIDSTLLNVSLSTLIRELHTTLQSLQWVISAYSLMLAALTVTGGRMGDLFGRKRMFMGGAIIFAIGSFIASISRSVPVLLLGESIIEGIGAALMMPATASLLVSKYRGHDRAIAFGIWGGVAAAASAIGPILGGFLTTHFSWRWGFRINLFVAALLLAGSIIVEDTQQREGKRIDWLGVLLSAAGLFFVVFGIIESETYGWMHARKPFPLWQPGSISITPVALAIGAAILVLFGIWERRLEERGGTPIVSMRLFQNQQFVAGASVVGVLMLAQNGVIFSLPVFLQSVKQLDAFHTGLTLLPMSLMLLIVSPAAATLTKRIPHKRLVQAGLIINTIAIVILRFTIGVNMNLTWLIPGLALYGVGLGLVLSQINNLTLSAVPVREAGEASGVTNTFRQIGASLGAAVIGAILISTILIRLDTAVAESATIPPHSKAAITRMLDAQATGLAFGESGIFDSLPPQIRSEMMALRRTATTVGIQRAFLCGALFALLGLAVSTLLPLRPKEHAD
ncbi:MAG TPA: MFS transporter [Thermoanaerobaculia bacterium]|nr:MFS transporter [Thermoanaerobaculia bacterium]